MGIKKIPRRQCIGCNDMKEKKKLIRIVKTNEGEITIDTTGKKNGRGAYICPSKDCMSKVAKNHGLDRSFKLSVPIEVYDKLMEEVDSIDTK